MHRPVAGSGLRRGEAVGALHFGCWDGGLCRGREMECVGERERECVRVYACEEVKGEQHHLAGDDDDDDDDGDGGERRCKCTHCTYRRMHRTR